MFTMDSLIGLPVLSLIFVIWIFSATVFPTSIGAFEKPQGAVILLVLIVGFIVDRVLLKIVSRYKSEPITSNSYSTTVDSLAIFAAFLISFTYFLTMIGIVVALHKALRT